LRDKEGLANAKEDGNLESRALGLADGSAAPVLPDTLRHRGLGYERWARSDNVFPTEHCAWTFLHLIFLEKSTGTTRRVSDLQHDSGDTPDCARISGRGSEENCETSLAYPRKSIWEMGFFIGEIRPGDGVQPWLVLEGPAGNVDLADLFEASP
jgi:hypothetical protein